MEWWLVLLLIFGGFLLLMATGLPVAFCFMLVNLIAVSILWGGGGGLEQLILSIDKSVATFSLLALPMFVLMGEVMFQSEVAPFMIDALDKWLGRLPGRLSLLAVASGTVIATLTGVSMSSVAMLGSTLVPDMEKRGYKKSMSIGPIMGSGGLAIMIPPSSLAVFVGAIGQISIGRILIAIIIPGLLMAAIYAAYIIIRCWLQPSLAPTYAVTSPSLLQRLIPTVRYILPVALILFLVVGVILLGIATPTEAAATGALGTFLLAAAYRKLNWRVVKKALSGSIQITVMLLMIIAAATAFSQLLCFTGATTGLCELALGLPVAPILIIVATQVVVLILGMFMGASALIMITLPLFVPFVTTLGFDPVWFAVIFLLNLEIGTMSPPYGMNLFAMQGVAPPGTTMGDIYKAALPFVYCNLVAMALLITFPAIVLWLPGLMR